MAAICHVVRQFSPSVGGLESFVENLARELVRAGNDCDVITLDRLFRKPAERLPPRESVGGLSIARVPMLGHPRLFLPLFPAEAFRSYDVIHVHGVDGMFDRVAFEPRRPRQLLVATTHGLFFHTPWMKSAKQIYFQTITRAAAQRYDAIIATSSADQTLMRRLRPDVEHIPNGVAPLACAAHGGDLLSHGRLASHKRLDLLIETLAQPVLAGVQLHIAGPEWDVSAAALRDCARANNVAERVHIHGSVSASRLLEIASGCGLFVCASEYEGFGMALIEAFSAGLSAVVSANPSFAEIMQAAPTGRLADFHDPAAAALIVRDELQRLSAEKRQASKAYAATFSWRNNAERTLAVYDAAQARKRRQAA
jgi:alpha-1,3-mannosyltransferase